MRTSILPLLTLSALALLAPRQTDATPKIKRRIAEAAAKVRGAAADAADAASGGCPFISASASAFKRTKRATSRLAQRAEAKEVLERVLAALDDAAAEEILAEAFIDDAEARSAKEIVRAEVARQIEGCTNTEEEIGMSNETPCGSEFDTKFSRVTGHCHNLKYTKRGMAGSQFVRLLKPRYEDGVNQAVGWTGDNYHGFALPSPRKVSVSAVATDDPDLTRNTKHSWMNIQWGQFLDHDMTLTPEVIDGSCADNCENNDACYPIQRTDEGKNNCYHFVRSAATCGENTVREQFNDLTSYIDGGMIYGNTETKLTLLRDQDDKRLLKVGRSTEIGKKSLLPDDEFSCTSTGGDAAAPCMMAGDDRANIIPSLLSLHTIFLREHNRIALQLSTLNPNWDDETIFQTTRKIVIALLQHITYKNWLPWLLKDPPAPPSTGFSNYDEEVDPSLSNEFSTAAFRCAHGTIYFKSYMLEAGFDGSIRGPGRNLSKIFFATGLIHETIDPFLRGLMGRQSKTPNNEYMVTTELTEGLFGSEDLAARNIQRGRDHGLPPYTDYLLAYKFINSLPETFADLKNVITNAKVLDKLETLYGHPQNIDLWVGGLAETRPAGFGAAGPLFDKIMTDQFNRTMYGDRFFYTHEGCFTPLQLAEIRKSSLARIICDNNDGGIESVPANVFLKSDPATTYLSCADVPALDLSAWESSGGAPTDANPPTIKPPKERPKRPRPNFPGHNGAFEKPGGGGGGRHPGGGRGGGGGPGGRHGGGPGGRGLRPGDRPAGRESRPGERPGRRPGRRPSGRGGRGG